MLDFILSYVNTSQSRAIPEYSTFLRQQKIFVDDRYNRIFSSFGNETNGLKLLKYILQFNDWDYFYNNCENNYQRYMQLLRYTRRDLMNIFDRTSRGRGYFGLFFEKGCPTEEFLMPIEDINTAVNLPLESHSWMDWVHVKPLRIIDHDSPEFTTNILNSRIKFSKQYPIYAIELLDVIGLMFKYSVWFKDRRPTEGRSNQLAWDAPMQYFLHKYIVCDLIYDLADVFLIRQFERLLFTEAKDMSKFDSNAIQVEPQYGRINTACRRAYDALHKVVQYTARSTDPSVLLNSNLLFSGSINQRILEIDKTLSLPFTRPYEYATWMRDSRLFSLFVNTYLRRPDLPFVKTMMVNIKRDYKRMLNRRVWNSCNNVELKNTVEKAMMLQAHHLRID